MINNRLPLMGNTIDNFNHNVKGLFSRLTSLDTAYLL